MALLAGSLAALVTQGAWAQEVQTRAVELPKFNPAVSGDRFFGVPSPYAAGDLAFHSDATLEYARDPLTLVRRNGTDTEEIGTIVSDQLILHLGVALSLASRVQISANMPFVLLSRGDPASGGDESFREPTAQALGDLRLGVRFRLVGDYYDAFQLGVGGYVWVPTGSDDSYVSDGAVRGQPQLLLGGRADRFIWTLMAGPTLTNKPVQFGGLTLGHRMEWGGGVGVLLADHRTVQLGVETYGGVDVVNPDTQLLNEEILGDIKWRLPHAEALEIGIAAGPGIASGIGTPKFRGAFQLAYTPEPKRRSIDSDGDGILDDLDACPKVPGKRSQDPAKNGCPETDRDHDGVLDDVDACPDEPGKANKDPKKNGCPIRDTDKDGILDDVDACPNEPGVASDDPAKNGCPFRDRDGDGVADEVDACVDIPGVHTDDPKTNGCPPDSDGDGFRDDIDACPHEKGPDNKDPSKRGCPKLVVFTDSEVKILEQVQFDFAKATIRPASNELLDEIAQVVKDHAEVVKLEVQGHTDNIGPAPYNKKLSEDRAKSVMSALVKRGVDQSRLTATGYGFDKPIADNKTDAGRQVNRRVQFIVVEKKPIPVTTTKQGVTPPRPSTPADKP